MSQRISPEEVQAAIPRDALVDSHGQLHVHLGRCYYLDARGSDISQLGAGRVSPAVRLLEYDWTADDSVDDDGRAVSDGDPGHWTLDKLLDS